MANILSKIATIPKKILYAVVGLIVLLLVVVLALRFMGSSSSAPPQQAAAPTPVPEVAAMVAPPSGAKVMQGTPLQIQNVNLKEASRVELWVSKDGAPEQQISSVAYSGPMMVQQWIPQNVGNYTINVKSFNADNAPVDTLSTQIAVVNEPAIVLNAPSAQPVAMQQAPALEQSAPVQNDGGQTPTGQEAPAVEEPVEAQADITVSEAPIEVLQDAETVEEIRRYPPPPPAPGIPVGPTQAELPALSLPTGDAAEYVGVYGGDPNRRIYITEDDTVAPKVVGGTTVFRAWRLQNVGVNTWGPGYELAFYGGRSMGSGGVIFESTFPGEPGRRNAIVDDNRLIVPEGQPNQVAVVEVMLTAPVTPGVHQSYWRMRNPQGIFFGPIMGVTMEVVRDCQFGNYGAPVINRFDIVGVGNVFRPENPATVRAEIGDNVTLEWDIINADNFDILFTDPTGDVETVSTPDSRSRATFSIRELGKHTITLFADNGPCTVSHDVIVDAVPPPEERFKLIIEDPVFVFMGSGTSAASGSVQEGNIRVEWDHYNAEANQFYLHAQGYMRTRSNKCLFDDPIFNSRWQCYEGWSDWRPTGKTFPIDVGGGARGAATISNVEKRLCPTSQDASREEYGIHYVMEAKRDGRPVSPQYSNAIDVRCPSSSSQLPMEMSGAFTPSN